MECENFEWGDRRDSNPQQPGPQPGALPLSYDHHFIPRQNGLMRTLYFDALGLFVNADFRDCRRRFKTRFFAGAKLDRFQREMAENRRPC